MQISKNFKLEEFVVSKTATRLGIDNTPNPEVVNHLQELVTTILQPLRDWIGIPFVITSGYRNAALNAFVGGVRDSAHLSGYACDIQIYDMDNFDIFCDKVREFLKDNNIAFDQCIIERSKTTRWLHLSVRNNNGGQRKQIFSISK